MYNNIKNQTNSFNRPSDPQSTQQMKKNIQILITVQKNNKKEYIYMDNIFSNGIVTS